MSIYFVDKIYIVCYNRENEGGKHNMTEQKNARARFKGIPFKEDDHALIDNARTRLSYYRGKQLTAAATDTTNWFPGSTLAGR